MAAGQGFKTFTTGEVLTAGDVNGYLMQGINVFASNAARDAAITSPQEGQFAYTKDTNSLWYYTGSAWAASGATGDIEGVSVTSPITGGGTSGTVTIGIDSTAVVPSQTGNSGKYLTTNGTSSSWATVSSGANTWTSRINPGSGGNINSIAYNGSNMYVAGASAGYLYSSPDGITWTSRTSGFGSNPINKVIYANSLFVAVGNQGTITTSSDGITWTARTANMSTNAINDIEYGGGLFVAVGAGGGSSNTGGLTYSSDGITWTRKSQTFTNVGDTYNSVTYNGTNWIIGTPNGTSLNAITASTPSGTWTEITVGGGSAPTYVVAYDGTGTWAITDTSYYYTTATNYTGWNSISNVTPASGANATYKNAIAFYNGRVYHAGYYLESFSKTVVNTNFVNKSNLELLPTDRFSQTTPFISGTLLPKLFVGSAGIILGSSSSTIFTTF